MEAVNVDGLARHPAFSHAVVASETIHVSGTLGTVADSMSLARGGVGAQTAQVLENLERILGACGAGLADIVKMTVYLSNIADFDEMNDAYVEVFTESPPARITIGGVELALGAAVEMECTARKPI